MERLPNGSLPNAGKTVAAVRSDLPRKALRKRGLGCIAQLVEQLTLNRQLSQRIQSPASQMVRNRLVSIQGVTRQRQNAHRLTARLITSRPSAYAAAARPAAPNGKPTARPRANASATMRDPPRSKRPRRHARAATSSRIRLGVDRGRRGVCALAHALHLHRKPGGGHPGHPFLPPAIPLGIAPDFPAGDGHLFRGSGIKPRHQRATKT
jgi:hypothetical protein